MTTPPRDGSKKTVPSWRSANTITSPAVSTGAARTTSSDVARMLQVKTGMRIIVMPGARIRRIVTMKLIPPRIEADPTRISPTIHRSCPVPSCSDSGAIPRPPGGGRAPLREEPGEDRQSADRQQPERERVDPRERHVERADLQRHEVVPEPREEREDHEEDHQGPVQREDLVVRMGRQDLRAGPGELRAHQEGEDPRDDEEGAAVEQVEDPDLLVVGRREPAEGAPLRLGDVLLRRSRGHRHVRVLTPPVLARRTLRTSTDRGRRTGSSTCRAASLRPGPSRSRAP